MSTLEIFLTGQSACKLFGVHVARDHLLVPTIWYGLLKPHWALWARCVTDQWTLVSQITQYSLTIFCTLVLLMHGVIGVADPSAHMATVQAELTRHQAPTFGGLSEVFSTGNLDLFFWVVLTAQVECFAHLSLSFQGAKDIAPQLDFAQYFTVPDDVEAFLGT